MGEIKSVVFDMGGVLIAWSRDEVLDNAGASGEERRLLLDNVLLAPEWEGMDRGELDEEEAEEIFRRRLPSSLHAKLHAVLYWDERIKMVDGMEDLLKLLRDKGLGVYLLSNASRRLHSYFPHFPFESLIMDKVVSADYGILKPDERIYHTAEEKFGIKGAESLFVDDTYKNVEGARNAGFFGYHFQRDTEKLKSMILKSI